MKTLAFLAGAAALGVAVTGLLANRPDFLRSYLQAYSLWAGLALGCLGVTLLHELVGGSWGVPLRGFLETGIRTLPLLAVLFVPIVLGMHDLYEWTHAEAATDPVLKLKLGYLNVPFFLGRTAFYFAVWFVLGIFAIRNGNARRRGLKPSQAVGAIGCLLFVPTVSFAALDWFMSTEPHWFSSIYGAIFMIGGLVDTLVFMVILLALFRNDLGVEGPGFKLHLHDLGKLMIMAVIVWAYFSFSQFLIIWSAQLPEEMTWYHHRSHGGWQLVGLTLILGHWGAPFAFLLSRENKRHIKRLLVIAIWLIAMRCVETWWQIKPAYYPGALTVSWLDPVAIVAIGGFWCSLYFFFLQRGTGAPLAALPQHHHHPVKTSGDVIHGPQDK